MSQSQTDYLFGIENPRYEIKDVKMDDRRISLGYKIINSENLVSVVRHASSSSPRKDIFLLIF